ncbi:uncharacterized protein LOC142353669 isoform X2 [Convolutriloba macropyga]|uniref:uncharacterized protein LOC142353669 isoform X1 n=1 Tax=Convolutriloba macropyga TaxID=536237 RepID=UPI003F52888F
MERQHFRYLVIILTDVVFVVQPHSDSLRPFSRERRQNKCQSEERALKTNHDENNIKKFCQCIQGPSGDYGPLSRDMPCCVKTLKQEFQANCVTFDPHLFVSIAGKCLAAAPNCVKQGLEPDDLVEKPPSPPVNPPKPPTKPTDDTVENAPGNPGMQQQYTEPQEFYGGEGYSCQEFIRPSFLLICLTLLIAIYYLF